MSLRPLAFNDRGWRKCLPVNVYLAIHSWQFKGANRLKSQLGLLPLDVEKLISAAVCSFSCSNSLFLDVGAQHGRHFRALLESGTNTTDIIAFEANPDMAVKLRNDFADAIASTRLTIINAAVSDSNGVAEFFINTYDSGYSGMVKRKIDETKDDYAHCTVSKVTIDASCANTTKPVSCIKIDIEGAEFNALKGAERILCESRPVVIFECVNNAAPFYGHSLSSIINWLEARNFETTTIGGQVISEEAANHIFASRHCCDFVCYPKERSEEIKTKLVRNRRHLSS